MIVDFTVENFRSIKKEQTLSMLVAHSKNDMVENIVHLSDESNLLLLKTALIYGPNASGKSNLILALDIFRRFIIDSTNLKIGEDIPYYTPYRADKSYLRKSTKLGIEFIGRDNIRYRYTIKFNKENVEFEELVFYPNKQEARLFLRNGDKDIKFGTYFKGKKQSIASELLPNNLFLSKAANSNHEQLREIYLYFLRNLKFHTQADSKGFLPQYTTRRLIDKEDDYKSKVIDFLKAADTRIEMIDVVVGNIDIDTINLPDNMPETLKKQIIEDFSSRPVTYHKLYDGQDEIGTFSFDLDEESNGTIKMYDLAGKIIEALENGHVFIIDELDSSFHPSMSNYILELFNNPKHNPYNAQLIVATHDVTLLDSKAFRRDQIWFTERNSYGATEIYSLDEFKKDEVRNNIPFGRWYLNGRFGALPFINRTLFSIDKHEEDRD